MKKIFFLFFLFSFVLAVPAQEKTKSTAVSPAVQQGNAASRATMLTEKQTALLNLTAEQKSKVYNINLDKCKQVDMARVLSGNSEVFKAQRKKINEQRDVEINALLTPEQQATWKKAKEENKKKKGQHTEDAN